MSGRQVKLKHAENSSIPYHYTKSNGINGIINHNCFWATKSDFLNDPNEFSYIQGIIEEVCRDTIKSPVLKEMFLADSIYSKHEGFAEEEEYRFVFKKQKDTTVYFRAKGGFMLPYIEIP